MLKLFLLIAALMAAPALVFAADEPAPAPMDTVTETININTANAEQLASSLKGVGTRKAEAIVAYREQHGPFTELAQLAEVKGIGEQIITANNDRIQF
ncbi:competence protein ComEA [Ferrimonas sediminum]|uniref:Competence protein ComEA n=1 Tax=Ferrimonas sediminum TaxID=718193 RepID=A0A1G8YJP9_9GAMM|nr:ComEA family DNA-binding protein [Ferrimonas sediminum]SDK02674.1 competence protein ComEA [Ferrimonas sediminum]